MLLAFEMAIHTGQRQGDLLSLTWKQYDGTHLSFQQGKTKKRVRVKVHSKLKAMIDALPKDKMRILNNSRGRPWTKDGFKTSWGKECARLKIEGVTFHDCAARSSPNGDVKDRRQNRSRRSPGTRLQRWEECLRSTIWRRTSRPAMPSFCGWKRTSRE
ncbi:hypothetical protein [Ensifer sesbaniae]|uniref:hypothetical protein n=1 Tax=Ensifer sesbaniae TaxID=1214071 RepID=UPI0035E3ED0F